MSSTALVQKPARAIIAAVQLSSVSDPEFEASLAELRHLAKTLGFEIAGTFTQKRARFDSAAYFSKEGQCAVVPGTDLPAMRQDDGQAHGEARRKCRKGVLGVHGVSGLSRSQGCRVADWAT